jgi:peptide/nickel transport system ATP-binding protein
MQIIFQDPYESLDPRMSIYDIISEPVRIQKATKNERETADKVRQVLEEFDLVPPEEYMYRFPHELSGGQRQRVAIARAFILDPEFIVADEPVSMLDASIRVEVLKLLLAMQKKLHTAFLYITHDIALARHMCDRIAVMYLGKIAEQGSTEDIVHSISVTIKGEVPSAIAPPPGCRFNTRCPHVMEICRKKEPLLKEVSNRLVACHLHDSK